MIIYVLIMILKISSKQALDLELKLNTSPYSRTWIDLGDVLYEWRIDPRYYQLTRDTSYKISRAQYEWINQNILAYSNDNDDNQFTLIIQDSFVFTHT